MITEELLEKIKLLDGISFLEWQKIKIIVDKSFGKQIGELKNNLKLSEGDLVILIWFTHLLSE